MRWQEWYESHVSEVTDAFDSHRNRLAMGGLFPNWALYYMKSTATENGSLLILRRDDETPLDLFIHAADVPSAVANGRREQVRVWIRRESGRLPILATVDRSA